MQFKHRPLANSPSRCGRCQETSSRASWSWYYYAPSTFQWLMKHFMGDLNRKEVFVFIDDLIVLKRLREFVLKLSPEKCKFCQTSVKYLGHVGSQHGVETDPAKVEALKTWPRPKNLKELRSFLGFSGYYRRFVQDYSKIVKPLNESHCWVSSIVEGSQEKG